MGSRRIIDRIRPSISTHLVERAFDKKTARFVADFFGDFLRGFQKLNSLLPECRNFLGRSHCGPRYSLAGTMSFAQPRWPLARTISSYPSGQRLMVVVVTGLPPPIG